MSVPVFVHRLFSSCGSLLETLLVNNGVTVVPPNRTSSLAEPRLTQITGINEIACARKLQACQKWMRALQASTQLLSADSEAGDVTRWK